MSGRKGLGVKIDDLIELLLERSRRRSRPAGKLRRRRRGWRAIAVGALRYFLASSTEQAHRLRLRRGAQLRGGHRSLPPVLARPRDNIFRKLEERGLAAEAVPSAEAGTTTSGRSCSTQPRSRRSRSERSTRSSCRRSPGTRSGSHSRSTTSTTGNPSSTKATRRYARAASRSRRSSAARCRGSSVSSGSRSREECSHADPKGQPRREIRRLPSTGARRSRAR